MHSITVNDSGLTLTLPGMEGHANFSWFWLRDHGEDEASQDPDTHQRRVDTFALDPDEVVAAHADVTVADDGVTVVWHDGTTSWCSRSMLEAVALEYLSTDWASRPELTPKIGPDVTLWPTPDIGPDEVDLAEFLDPSTQRTLTHGVEHLCRFGYLVLRGDVVDRAIAHTFVARLGYVRHTIFGGMWDLAPDLSEHADTAYTSVYLGPHTDGTYSHDAPGLQFFLCMEAAPSGGESLLVDGFAVADHLAWNEPEVYRALASIPVPGRYIEPGVHLRAERPVFRSDARGVLDQVSFNNYDRAPFLLPADQEASFYRAYRRFAQLAADPARRVAVSLTPGDILIFDNWRTMHGRAAFTGPRHYVGAYMNHEDLESKRRVLLAG